MTKNNRNVTEPKRLFKFVWIDEFNRANVSDRRLGQAKIIKCGNSLASKDNGQGFFCSRRELAERTGITEDEAKRALSILQQQGWMRQVRRGGRAGNGATWASEYELTIPSPSATDELTTDLADTSTGEPLQVNGGASAGQGASHSPPIRPSSIKPSTTSDPLTKSAEKEEASMEVKFKEPTRGDGGEWRVQVWRCPTCPYSGKEEILYRTAGSLAYVCSEGFLVEIPYTKVANEERALGAHYEVAADGKLADAIFTLSLAGDA